MRILNGWFPICKYFLNKTEEKEMGLNMKMVIYIKEFNLLAGHKFLNVDQYLLF